MKMICAGPADSVDGEKQSGRIFLLIKSRTGEDARKYSASDKTELAYLL